MSKSNPSRKKNIKRQSPREKGRPRLLMRLFAKLIDIFILISLFYITSIISNFLANILAIFYWVFIDNTTENGSPGKWLLGFKIISIKEPPYLSLKISAYRNLLFILTFLFYCFPLWGWYINLIIVFPCILVEIVLMYFLEEGTRLFDVLTDTRVIYDIKNTKRSSKKTKA